MKNKYLVGYYNYTVYATYLGLAVGIAGFFFALQGNSFVAMLLLMIAGLLDMFDGIIARTNKKRSESEKKFGIQIDSLSDMVNFGILPVAVGYSYGMDSYWYYILMVPYVLAALIRLAYFNVTEEKRQSTTSEKRKYYEGVPVTMTSIFFPISVCISLLSFGHIKAPWVYALFMGVFTILFVLKVKIPKPAGKGIAVLGVLGFAVFIVFIILSCCYGK